MVDFLEILPNFSSGLFYIKYRGKRGVFDNIGPRDGMDGLLNGLSKAPSHWALEALSLRRRAPPVFDLTETKAQKSFDGCFLLKVNDGRILAAGISVASVSFG